MNKYYIYAHSKPCGEVFYVGKGSNKRLFTTGNRNEFWKRIVKKYGYTASILEECLTEKEAYAREIFWISYYKELGQCVANFTNGGDGVNVDKRWWNEKISASLTGKKRPSGKLSHSYKSIDGIENIKELYLSGVKSTELSVIFGLSIPTILTRLRKMGVDIKSAGKCKKRILCITDNIEFESISDAAIYYGLFQNNIHKVLNGKYTHTGNKKFIYLGEQNEM